MLIGVWVARYLGPSQFGLLNFAIAYVSLFGIIAGAGLQTIVVREIVNAPGSRDEVLGSAAALLFLGGVLAYILTVASFFWLRPSDTLARALVVILSTVTLFKLSEIAIYWFESQVESKYVVYAQNTAFIICSACKIWLIYSGATVIDFAWINLIEALIVAILLIVMLFARTENLNILKFSIKKMRGLLASSWPLMLSGLTIIIYMKIDQIMLGQLLNDEAVGVYSAAVRISEAWYFVPTAIVASFFPTIIKAKKISEERYYALMQRLFDLMTVISLFVAIPMTLASPFLIGILYGNDYIGAASILSIHIWTAIFVFIGVAGSAWFVIEKKPMLALQRSILGAIINILLNFYLIPLHGTDGAAIATVFSYFIAAWAADLTNLGTRKLFLMKLRSFNIIGAINRIYSKQ